MAGQGYCKFGRGLTIQTDLWQGLAADTETRDVWLSLGVKEERLVALGMEDNFWEMGLAGPCGPCTELHYTSRPGESLAAATEVWNLVFMQYDRTAGGRLEPLATRHVDTGMGLERITAVLNGQESVFSTDLFQPLMEEIAAVSGRPQYTGQVVWHNRHDLLTPVKSVVKQS